MKITLNKTKKNGPLARRTALGAALIVAAVVAACSSSDSNLVSPSDSTSDARFSFHRTPSAPQSAAATAGSGSATVTWQAPANAGASKIYSYTVVTSPGNKSTRVSGSTLSATISGLTNGTTYTFTVYAANFFGSGPGMKTNAVTAGSATTTPPDTTTTPTPPDTTTTPTPPDTTTPPPTPKAPTAPTGVTATAGNAQASITWTAPSDSGSSKVASYTVKSAPGNMTATVAAPTTTATIGGLTNGTSYTFTVTATNKSLTSPASSPSTAITPTAPVNAPTGPQSVTATAGNAQATITWQAPANNGGSAITGYTVTSAPGGKAATVSGTTLSTTITGLANGTSYTFGVVATNAKGNGPSVNSNAVTPSAPVTPPPSSGRWISAYYVGYQRSMYPENTIDMSQLTHIFVGATHPTNGNQLTKDFYVDNTNGPIMAKNISARAHAAGKKAILMLGGAGDQTLLRTAANSSNLSGFITNLLSLMDQLGYDGIDVDWEPISGTADQTPLMALVQGLRSARPGIILTVPITWNYYEASAWYAQLSTYVDQINFMSYEMAGADWGWAQTWHSSALQGDNNSHPSSVNLTVTSFINAGVPAAKLGVGIGGYGDCWKGTTGPNQSTSGSSVVAGDNVMTYRDIMASYFSTGVYKWDATAQVPYLSSATGIGPKGCTFVSYDDEQSVTAKGQYIKAHGLGGAMLWTIGQQHIPTAAAGHQDPLITAVYTGMQP